MVISDPCAIVSMQTKSPKVLGAMDFQKIHLLSGLTDRIPFIFEVLHRRVYSVATASLAKRNLASVAIPINLHLFACLESAVPNDMIVELDLQSFVGRSMYRACFSILFGPSFSLDTYSDYATFDNDMFYVMSGIPFTARNAKAARERLRSYMQSYLEHNWRSDGGGHMDGASSVISCAVRELKDADLSDHEISCVLFIILWGIHSNMVQVTIWSILNLTNNPQIYDRIARDVRRAVERKASDFHSLLTADPSVLDDPDFAPLDSVVKETLRLSILPSTVRQVLHDTTIIGGNGKEYRIYKGEGVLVDVRGMHLDSDYFPDPESFKADRFMNIKGYGEHNGMKTLVPWGGGMYMCKGRTFAQHMIKMFLIMCFHLYDIDMHPNSSPPAASSAKSISVVRPDSALKIRLRKRQL